MWISCLSFIFRMKVLSLSYVYSYAQLSLKKHFFLPHLPIYNTKKKQQHHNNDVIIMRLQAAAVKTPLAFK